MEIDWKYIKFRVFDILLKPYYVISTFYYRRKIKYYTKKFNESGRTRTNISNNKENN